MNTQNDLITEKNNSMQSFMRNLVAMRQMKTKTKTSLVLDMVDVQEHDTAWRWNKFLSTIDNL